MRLKTNLVVNKSWKSCTRKMYIHRSKTKNIEGEEQGEESFSIIYYVYR
jgi:hypothetical protein